jgi:hypothetical protein
MPSRVLACTLLSLSLWLGACQNWPFRARMLRDCPGVLESTEAMTGDFLLQQSVRVASGDATWSLRLVSQLHGGELRLVGLDPLGVELFTLLQRGREVEVDALPPPLLEIPPENLLRDLHRIRFRGLAEPESDGVGQAVRGDVEIVETWQAGSIARRSFNNAAGDRRRRAEVVFSLAGGAERASVEHFACRYRAEFTTLDFQELR